MSGYEQRRASPDAIQLFPQNSHHFLLSEIASESCRRITGKQAFEQSRNTKVRLSEFTNRT